MNVITPTENPEADGQTQVADELEARAQTRTGEPFALALKADIAVRDFRRSAGCRGLRLRPEEGMPRRGRAPGSRSRRRGHYEPARARLGD